jgi:O-methyltransferase
MQYPTYSRKFAAYVRSTADPVRVASIALAIATIDRDGIEGDFAELGVWRGDLSVQLHHLAPERDLYLFDTFEGFPDPDGDTRFRDTSEEFVRGRFGGDPRVHVMAGVFPETTANLENRRFAFVMLDADRYQVTLDGLRFFYPRLTPGAYLFAHDYNSAEFEYGVRRAFDEFLADRPEGPVELPDFCGSVAFRRAAI